jgi:DNA mismatch endonuclease (patch repair protein)
MPDFMTPTQRHRCMSHIRSKATKPEMLVRRWLWAHGYRYRLNVKSVPSKPDIVMRKYRTAIFVSLSFFCKYVKQHLGMTAHQYRTSSRTHSTK